MLLKNLSLLSKYRVRPSSLIQLKNFSSNHKVDHHHNNSHSAHHNDGHGHGHDHGHGHGHGHDHHEITGEVDLNKVYVNLEPKDLKYISLLGCPEESRVHHYHLEGGIKAYKDMTPFPLPFITKNRVWFRELANVPDEENPYVHPEPLGYLTNDDPHDPESGTYWKWMYFVYILAALFLLQRGIKSNPTSLQPRDYAEKIYHAHYTANLIEDEIRRIREEDYAYRKKYHELKTGVSESSESEE